MDCDTHLLMSSMRPDTLNQDMRSTEVSAQESLHNTGNDASNMDTANQELVRTGTDRSIAINPSNDVPTNFQPPTSTQVPGLGSGNASDSSMNLVSGSGSSSPGEIYVLKLLSDVNLINFF